MLAAKPCRGSGESAVQKKIVCKNHLSPSRRRALRPFFVQRLRVVHSALQARRTAGSLWEKTISQNAKFC